MQMLYRSALVYLLSFVLTLSTQVASAQTLDPQQKGLLQSVQLLEMKLFGRTFFGEPILKRVDRLEDVVGLPHAKDRGALARVDEIEKQIPRTPEDRHKAAKRAIEAENTQISDKIWQNLSVVGVAVKLTEVKFSYVPPPAVRAQFDTWRTKFINDIEQICSASLGSMLAHTFSSVRIGAATTVDCRLADGKVSITAIRGAESKELDESINKALANYESAMPPAWEQPLTITLNMRVEKQSTQN